ncbi:MAG: hypothetical protein NDF55_08975 [archaeon GB-1867-005]|nr:hypothetical protein [Candidatus Culexmicrobium cathedralense]
MRERLKRPKTPLDTLRLVNLRNRLRASGKDYLRMTLIIGFGLRIT